MSTQKRLSLHTMVFAGSTKTNCAFPATESVPKSKQRTEVNTIYLFIHPPFGRLGEPPLHGEAPVSCKMTPLKSRLLQQNHLMHLSKVSSGNLVEVDSTRNVFGVPDHLVTSCLHHTVNQCRHFLTHHIIHRQLHIAGLR